MDLSRLLFEKGYKEMKVGIRARLGFWTSATEIATYLEGAESWSKHSWCEEGLLIFRMTTPEEKTPRQVSDDYDYWSLHPKEVRKDKKF